MVLIPLIFNYGINTNAMEIARFALDSTLNLLIRKICIPRIDKNYRFGSPTGPYWPPRSNNNPTQ